MYSSSINTIVCRGLAFLLPIAICTSCQQDETAIDDPAKPDKVVNFIPAKNKKFIYKIAGEDGSAGTATQNISGSKDSSGITVYNLHSVVQASGQSITMDNKIFNLNGKTYTEIKVPDAWHQYVALLGQMPGIKVTKTELLGYPAYMVMQNALKNGSTITTTGSGQEQLIEYTNHGEPGSNRQEITQQGGTAKVETITVPAGSFVCNKFSYATDTKITVNAGSRHETAGGYQKVTVWMAHGIGMVKQESTGTLVSVILLPTGEIKKIVTNTASTTTLQKIE